MDNKLFLYSKKKKRNYFKLVYLNEYPPIILTMALGETFANNKVGYRSVISENGILRHRSANAYFFIRQCQLGNKAINRYVDYHNMSGIINVYFFKPILNSGQVGFPHLVHL